MSVLDGPRREHRRILLDGRPQWCEPDGDALALSDGRRVPEGDAVYLPPCDPSKILCVHLNYHSRAVEFGRSLDGETPTYFQKPVSALNAHRGALVRPADCHWLNYEGEIAAVVGRPMRNVSPAEVWDRLAGFAPANDVGAHDFRGTDAGSMLRVKGMDGFCPIGPGIVRGTDVGNATLRTFLNGEMVQEGPVGEMVWGIDYLLADLSRHITLVPGDVVLTGTPWHSRPMAAGDVVEVEIDGLGHLANPVAEGPAPAHALGHQPIGDKRVRAVALGKDYRRMKDEGYGVEPRDYFDARDEFLRRSRDEGPGRALDGACARHRRARPSRGGHAGDHRAGTAGDPVLRRAPPQDPLPRPARPPHLRQGGSGPLRPAAPVGASAVGHVPGVGHLRHHRAAPVHRLHGRRLARDPGPVRPGGAVHRAGTQRRPAQHRRRRLWIGAPSLDELAHAAGTGIVPCGPTGPDQAIEWLRELPVTLISATPSWMRLLAERAARSGEDLSGLGLRTGLLGGEGSNSSLKRGVSNAFGAGFRWQELYGSTETGGPILAFAPPRDPFGGRLNVNTDYFVVELLRPGADEPAASGEIGELTLSTPYREGTVLIRYRTRDLAVSLPGERDASGWPQITALVGRTDDAIKVRGALVYPSVIEEVLTERLARGAEWRIEVDGKRAANETITIRYEHPDDALQDDLAALLYRRIGVRPVLEAVPPDTFERFSAKAARVVDRRWQGGARRG